MHRALSLAEKGLFTTDPNPRVGCVIVRDGTIIGEGWHERAGEPHAEVNALRAAGNRARGADAFVTLEPCSHTGRTPPCADALVAAGVRKVWVAQQDPNPQVSGQGLARLRQAGIEVESGLLATEAEALNPGFLKRMRSGKPWVRLKSGVSLDGKTALSNGESQWITSPQAREDVQYWRARSSAVLTGVDTVLADNPSLTVRSAFIRNQSPGGLRQPLRVVLDRNLRIPEDCTLLTDGGAIKVFTSEAGIRLKPELAARLDDAGALEVVDPGAGLDAVISRLGDLACNEILVEAGGKLTGAMLHERCWDEYCIYMAPRLLGPGSRDMADIPPVQSLGHTLDFAVSDVRCIGPDVRMILTPVRNPLA